MAQAPVRHALPMPHATPHAPQLFGSDWRFTHWPAQIFCPAGQATAHWPATHALPVGHALPHAPQLAGSVWTLAHNPLQSVCPEGQLEQPASAGSSSDPTTNDHRSVARSTFIGSPHRR
jgi:hypothetical protein